MTAPRFVRPLAFATLGAAGVLLSLGWLTTSFQAGMADPVWPTEPWYLAVNGHVWREPSRAFLLEHTHRAAGWVVGGLTTLLAVAAWAGDRRVVSRCFGIVAVAALIAVYGLFHRQMGAAWEARKAGLGGETWPATSGAATLVAALAVLIAAAASDGPGRWLRRLASVLLVAVMGQGLLGGYRVYLHQLVGPELAMVHGTAAQVVLCLLAVTIAFTRPPRPVPDAEWQRLGRLALLLPVAVFVQLVWGVLVRHSGGAGVQRLHLLTAFVVAGLAVWLAAKVLATPAGRRHLGRSAYLLLAVVGVQVLLGVEAWMGRFAAVGGQAGVPPMLRVPTLTGAVTRSAHALVGAALLASAVLLAVRVWRRPPACRPAVARAVAEPAELAAVP